MSAGMCKMRPWQEVQQELCASRSTVYRLVQAGGLDALHIGPSVRITRKLTTLVSHRVLPINRGNRVL
jgi:excisionase family DNA binding protein